jgi:hypothetical protein
VPERLLPVDQHQGSQERDRDREGDHANHSGGIQRGSADERLHQDEADCYQPAVAQVVLPDPLLLQLRVLRDVLRDPFGLVLRLFLEPLGFVFCVLGHGHHRGLGTPEG